MANISLITRQTKNVGLPPTNNPLSFEEMDDNFSKIETAINFNNIALTTVKEDVIKNLNLSALTQKVENNSSDIFNIRNTETSLVARLSNSDTSIINDINIGFGGILDIHGGKNIHLYKDNNRVLINAVYEIAGEPDENKFGVSQVNFTDFRAKGLDSLLDKHPLTGLQLRVVNYSSPTNSTLQFIDRKQGEPITLSFPYETSSGRRNQASATINSSGQIQIVVPKAIIGDGEFSEKNLTKAKDDKLNSIQQGANKTIVRNDLTSTKTDEALSAPMGGALDTKISKVKSDSDIRLAKIESDIPYKGINFVEDAFNGTTVVYNNPDDDNKYFSIFEAKRLIHEIKNNNTLSSVSTIPYNLKGSRVTGLGVTGSFSNGDISASWTKSNLNIGDFVKYTVLVYNGTVLIPNPTSPPAGELFSQNITTQATESLNQFFTGISGQTYTIAIISDYGYIGGDHQHVETKQYIVSYITSVPGVGSLSVSSSLPTARGDFGSSLDVSWTKPSVPTGATFVKYELIYSKTSGGGALTSGGSTISPQDIVDIDTLTSTVNDIALLENYTVKVLVHYTLDSNPISQEVSTTIDIGNKISFNNKGANQEIPVEPLTKLSVTATDWNKISISFDSTFVDLDAVSILSNGSVVGTDIIRTVAPGYSFTKSHSNFESTTEFGSITLRLKYKYNGVDKTHDIISDISGRISFSSSLITPTLTTTTYTPSSDVNVANIGILNVAVSGIPNTISDNYSQFTKAEVYVSSTNITTNNISIESPLDFETMLTNDKLYLKTYITKFHNPVISLGLGSDKPYKGTIGKATSPSVYPIDNMIQGFNGTTLNLRMSNESGKQYIYIITHYTHPSSGAVIKKYSTDNYFYSHNKDTYADSFNSIHAFRDIDSTLFSNVVEAGTRTSGSSLDEAEVSSSQIVTSKNTFYADINDVLYEQELAPPGSQNIKVTDLKGIYTVEQQAIDNIFNKLSENIGSTQYVENQLILSTVENSNKGLILLFVATNEASGSGIVADTGGNTITEGLTSIKSFRKIFIKKRLVQLNSTYLGRFTINDSDKRFVEYTQITSGTTHPTNTLVTNAWGNNRITGAVLSQYSYPNQIDVLMPRSTYNQTKRNTEFNLLSFKLTQGAQTVTININTQVTVARNQYYYHQIFFDKNSVNINHRIIYDFLQADRYNSIRDLSTFEHPLFQTFDFSPAGGTINFTCQAWDKNMENIFISAGESDTSFLKNSVQTIYNKKIGFDTIE